MRVLLVAEGQHERGKEDRDGALETLVRRLHQDITQCDLDRVSRKDIHAHHGKGQGYFKKAIRWILEAEKRGYDAIVLIIDQDNALERVQESPGPRTINWLPYVGRSVWLSVPSMPGCWRMSRH